MVDMWSITSCDIKIDVKLHRAIIHPMLSQRKLYPSCIFLICPRNNPPLVNATMVLFGTFSSYV